MNVVDASVSVKWVFEEDGSDEAREVLRTEGALAAPSLWRLETANALARKHQEGVLAPDDVHNRLAYLARVPIVIHEDRALLPGALDLSFELKHPVYDCIYLALALREGGRVLTANKPFVRSAERAGRGGFVRLIGPDQP